MLFLQHNTVFCRLVWSFYQNIIIAISYTDVNEAYLAIKSLVRATGVCESRLWFKFEQYFQELGH